MSNEPVVGPLGETPRGRRRDERGDTLVEVLVAIVILGIGAVALLAGFASAINGSSVHKNLTDSSNIVKTVSNEITAAMQSSSTSFTCPAAAVPSVTVPSGYAISASSVSYWTQDSVTQQWSWSPTCSAGTPELVTITLKNTANDSLNTSSFVVVDPIAPSSPSAGAATQVAFLVKPGGAQRGQPFLTQPVVAIEDASGNIVTNDLSPLKLTSSDGTLTGCYGQETSGVVTYTGCQFAAVGTFTVTATDGTLQSSSASVVVAKSPSTITVSSTPPTLEIAGQPGTYTPTATSTSGDVVTVSTSSSLICSVTKGVVSFTSVGDCVVDFNDPGNANYAPATQVTQEIPVVNVNQITLPASTQQFAPQVNGPTLTPGATALSGDTVIITSNNPQYCTVSGGVVSFVGATPPNPTPLQVCSLTFSDPAIQTNPNSTFEAAPLVTLTYAVAKGANSITVSSSTPTTATYGGSYSPTATATSGDTVVITSSPSSVCTYDSTTGLVNYVGVGQCTVSYADSGNTNYLAATTQTQTFAVAPAPLTVIAQPATSTYGSNPPSFGWTYSGLVNGDGRSVVSGTPAFTSSVGPTTPVGQYPLTVAQGTLSATNYVFTTFTPSTVTVQPAPLTVMASSPTSTYGSTPVPCSYKISGIVNNESAAQAYSGVPNVSCSVTASTGVGIYPVSVTQGNLQPTSNYYLVFMNGTYTVQPAVLTVTASPATMVYGAALPSFSSTITGYVNGDGPSVVSGSPSYTTSATTTSGVGHYPLTLGLGTLSAVNYTFQFTPSTVTVTPRTLTVSATGSSTYGATPAPPTVTYSGFVNGDTAAVLSGAPTISDSVTSTSAVNANYPIAVGVGTLTAQNYTLVAQPGSYSVSPAPLYVTANNQATTFGQPIPTLTDTVTGIQNNDPIASVYSGTPSLSTSATSTSRPDAGLYTISVAPGTFTVLSSNYTPVYQSGSLTIQKAALTVTANSVSMTYGSSLPTLGYSVSGFVAPDTSSVISGTPILQTSATATSPVGSYAVSVDVSRMSATNYTFVPMSGMITITQDTSTISVTTNMTQGMVVGFENQAQFGVTVSTGHGEKFASSDQATVTLTAGGQSVSCLTPQGGWTQNANNTYSSFCSVGANALSLASGTEAVTLSASFPGDANVGASTSPSPGVIFTLYSANPDVPLFTMTTPTFSTSKTGRQTVTTGTFSGSAPNVDAGHSISLYYCTSNSPSLSGCSFFTSLIQPQPSGSASSTPWTVTYTFSSSGPQVGRTYYFYASEPDYYFGVGNIVTNTVGPVTT